VAAVDRDPREIRFDRLPIESAMIEFAKDESTNDDSPSLSGLSSASLSATTIRSRDAAIGESSESRRL